MEALAVVCLEEERMYVFLTVGEKISALASSYFNSGDYVKGMLADAMADTLLFEVEHQLMAELKEIAAEWKVGVKARLESPPADLPMEAQKEILEHTKAEEFGISLSGGYTSRPVKSSGFILELTEDVSLFKSQHDCSKCPNQECPLRGRSRKVIRVSWEGRELELPFQEGESLLEILRRGGVMISAPCGGSGRCGKCAVRVTRGSLPVTEEDRRFFSEEESEQGDALGLLCPAAGDIVCGTGGKGGKGF